MRVRPFISVFAALSLSCSALLGVREIYLDENAAGQDGGPDGTTGGDGGLPDGTTVLPDGNVTCNADLQTDGNNCGRCGRSCLGGGCKAGKCEPVVIGPNLTNPSGLWLAASSVFITTGPHDQTPRQGQILEFPKAGGTPKVVIGAQSSPWGLFIDGMTLYWADSDYPNNGTDRHGGIWKCTLPTCAAPTLVLAADNPVNPVFAGGVIYVAEGNNSQVLRVLPDGTQPYALHIGSPGPLNTAVDKTHVYSTSRTTSAYRALLDGGMEQVIGPQSPGNVAIPGDIKLDDERYYYSYSSTDLADGGHVVSRPKSNIVAPMVEYGPGNTMPRGIAVDANYVYWTNWGTYTGNIPNSDGDVRACPKAGCPASGPIVLASGYARPYHIAVDDSGVYFTVYTSEQTPGTGTLNKVAKP